MEGRVIKKRNREEGGKGRVKEEGRNKGKE